MLCLTRCPNQSIVIGGKQSDVPEIRVMLLEIRGDKIRIGIAAPSSVPVHRDEIYDTITDGDDALASAKHDGDGSPVSRIAMVQQITRLQAVARAAECANDHMGNNKQFLELSIALDAARGLF